MYVHLCANNIHLIKDQTFPTDINENLFLIKLLFLPHIRHTHTHTQVGEQGGNSALGILQK